MIISREISVKIPTDDNILCIMTLAHQSYLTSYILIFL